MTFPFSLMWNFDLSQVTTVLTLALYQRNAKIPCPLISSRAILNWKRQMSREVQRVLYRTHFFHVMSCDSPWQHCSVFSLVMRSIHQSARRYLYFAILVGHGRNPHCKSEAIGNPFKGGGGGVGGRFWNNHEHSDWKNMWDVKMVESKRDPQRKATALEPFAKNNNAQFWERFLISILCIEYIHPFSRI